MLTPPAWGSASFVAVSSKSSRELGAHPQLPSLLPTLSAGKPQTDGPGRIASSAHPPNTQLRVASQRRRPVFLGNVGGRIPSVMEVPEREGVKEDVQVQPGTMLARVLSILP